MDKNFEIRRASKADAGEIARIHVGATRAAYRGIYTADYLNELSVEDRAYRWVEAGKGHLDLGDPFGVFVAFENGIMVGFADIGPAEDISHAELYAIYLDPDYIGKGAGKALFQMCADYAKQHGFNAMTTNVLSKNSLARKFYERMGGSENPETERLVETGGTKERVISYQWHAF